VNEYYYCTFLKKLFRQFIGVLDFLESSTAPDHAYALPFATCKSARRCARISQDQTTCRITDGRIWRATDAGKDPARPGYRSAAGCSRRKWRPGRPEFPQIVHTSIIYSTEAYLGDLRLSPFEKFRKSY